MSSPSPINQVYPERLLPSIEKVEKFTYSQNCLICRRSKIDLVDLYDDDGNLVEIAIEERELIDCSTNLINDKSIKNVVNTEPADVLITLDKDLQHLTMTNWDKSLVVPNPESLRFTISSEKGFYFIPINYVDNIELTFPFSKKTLKPNVPKPILNLSIKATYSPNMVNVCHFEITCYCNVNGAKEKVTRGDFKGYRAEICHTIKRHLIDKGLLKFNIKK